MAPSLSGVILAAALIGCSSNAPVEEPVDGLSLANPSFEEDTVADGKYNDKVTPAGWRRYDPAGIIGRDFNTIGVVNPTGTTLYSDRVPEGRNAALIFLWRDETSGTAAGIEQPTSHVLRAHTAYTLTVGVGNIAHDGAPNYSLVGFPGYRVELLAGDTVIARDDSRQAPADGKFAVSTTSVAIDADHPQLGAALTVRLINLNRPASGIEVNFDGVVLRATPR